MTPTKAPCPSDADGARAGSSVAAPRACERGGSAHGNRCARAGHGRRRRPRNPPAPHLVLNRRSPFARAVKPPNPNPCTPEPADSREERRNRRRCGFPRPLESGADMLRRRLIRIPVAEARWPSGSRGADAWDLRAPRDDMIASALTSVRDRRVDCGRGERDEDRRRAPQERPDTVEKTGADLLERDVVLRRERQLERLRVRRELRFTRAQARASGVRGGGVARRHRAVNARKTCWMWWTNPGCGPSAPRPLIADTFDSLFDSGTVDPVALSVLAPDWIVGSAARCGERPVVPVPNVSRAVRRSVRRNGAPTAARRPAPFFCLSLFANAWAKRFRFPT